MDQPDTFAAWALYHATAFGLNEDQTRTVATWREAFAALRYTGDELHTATTRMLTEAAPPKYPSDHLARVHTRVRAIRAETGPKAVPGGSEPALSEADRWAVRVQLRESGAVTTPLPDSECPPGCQPYRPAGAKPKAARPAKVMQPEEPSTRESEIPF